MAMRRNVVFIPGRTAPPISPIAEDLIKESEANWVVSLDTVIPSRIRDPFDQSPPVRWPLETLQAIRELSILSKSRADLAAREILKEHFNSVSGMTNFNAIRYPEILHVIILKAIDTFTAPFGRLSKTGISNANAMIESTEKELVHLSGSELDFSMQEAQYHIKVAKAKLAEMEVEAARRVLALKSKK